MQWIRNPATHDFLAPQRLRRAPPGLWPRNQCKKDRGLRRWEYISLLPRRQNGVSGQMRCPSRYWVLQRIGRFGGCLWQNTFVRVRIRAIGRLKTSSKWPAPIAAWQSNFSKTMRNAAVRPAANTLRTPSRTSPAELGVAPRKSASEPRKRSNRTIPKQTNEMRRKITIVGAGNGSESPGPLGVHPGDTLASAGSYFRANPSDFPLAHNEQDLNPAAAAKARW